jgi:hypothetical protein
MALPHYTQNKAAVNKYEVVHPNLFEVTIMTPLNADSALILEHVRSIGGLSGVNPMVDPVVQKYKWADRSYAGMPSQTYVDLNLNFTLNLNNANEFYMYKTMKEWTDLIHNPATGEMGLKVDYVGTLVVVQFNREGDIFRKLTFKDCFPTGNIQTLDELNYDSPEPAEMQLTIRSDHWDEENN